MHNEYSQKIYSIHNGYSEKIIQYIMNVVQKQVNQCNNKYSSKFNSTLYSMHNEYSNNLFNA